MKKNSPQNKVRIAETSISEFVSRIPQIGFSIPPYTSDLVRSPDGMFGVAFLPCDNKSEIDQFLDSVKKLEIEGISIDEEHNVLFTNDIENFQNMIAAYVTRNPDHIDAPHLEKMLKRYESILNKLDVGTANTEQNISQYTLDVPTPLIDMKYRRSAYILTTALENIAESVMYEGPSSEVGDVELFTEYDEINDVQHFDVGFEREGNVENCKGIDIMNELCDRLLDLNHTQNVVIRREDTDKAHFVHVSSDNPIDLKNLIVRYYYQYDLFGPEDVIVAQSGTEFKEAREEELSEIRDEYNKSGKLDLDLLPMRAYTSHEEMLENYQAGSNAIMDVSLAEIEGIIRHEQGSVPQEHKNGAYLPYALH